jgi:hypothetical protein
MGAVLKMMRESGRRKEQMTQKCGRRERKRRRLIRRLRRLRRLSQMAKHLICENLPNLRINYVFRGASVSPFAPHAPLGGHFPDRKAPQIADFFSRDFCVNPLTMKISMDGGLEWRIARSAEV